MLINPEEAARRLGIGRNKAYDWVKDGTLKAVRDGRRWRIAERALADLEARIAGGELKVDEPA